MEGENGRAVSTKVAQSLFCAISEVSTQNQIDSSPIIQAGLQFFMASYKQPTFQERTALAVKTKKAALEKLLAKPPVDEAVLAERRAAALIRDAAQRKAREDKLAARAAEKALKEERRAQNVVTANTAAPALTPEEQKLARDAKYAARKSRLGKR